MTLERIIENAVSDRRGKTDNATNDKLVNDMYRYMFSLSFTAFRMGMGWETRSFRDKETLSTYVLFWLCYAQMSLNIFSRPFERRRTAKEDRPEK